MSSTLLARLRKVERITRLVAQSVAPEWREPFRVTDYHRPVAIMQRRGFRAVV